jgi:hypothetical protein
MRGITTYNLGKKEEGFELAKRGIRNDLSSHICWHVHALMYRAERNHAEALKCYIQANRIERVCPDHLLLSRVMED